MKHLETAAKSRIAETANPLSKQVDVFSVLQTLSTPEFKAWFNKKDVQVFLNEVNDVPMVKAEFRVKQFLKLMKTAKASLAETAAKIHIVKPKLHPWAVAMLNVVQGIIPKGSGFVGDMSSSDGAYVDAKTAAKIVNAFKEDGHKITNFSGGFNKPGGSTSIDSKDDSQCGITVSDDDGDKVLTFFDQNS